MQGPATNRRELCDWQGFGESTSDSLRPLTILNRRSAPVIRPQRLIQLLLGTSMYALNGRLPCMQPAWTRCRMSRAEQSILDYVLGDTDCFLVLLLYGCSRQMCLTTTLCIFRWAAEHA